jgi:hypothetical protein
MKPPDRKSPLAKPINECPLRRTEPRLAHSKGKPGVSPTKTNINVRFATPLTEEIQIRVVENEAGWHRQPWLVPLLTLTVPGDSGDSPYLNDMPTEPNGGGELPAPGWPIPGL